MIIYLDENFTPVDQEKAVMAKVIPDDGSAPYFVSVDTKTKDNAERASMDHKEQL